MSIIQQHTSASLSDAWRTINVDALTEDSSVNFDTSTLHASSNLPETSDADARQINAQVRQLLRGGDAEGALRGCLEMPVYNGSEGAKVFFSSPGRGMGGVWLTMGDRTRTCRLWSRCCSRSRRAI